MHSNILIQKCNVSDYTAVLTNVYESRGELTMVFQPKTILPIPEQMESENVQLLLQIERLAN